MTIKDQLQKYQGEMVKFTLAVEEKGQPISKTGRVHSCEDDHVVYIDGIGGLQYIVYAHIAHLEQAWDGDHWSREPRYYAHFEVEGFLSPRVHAQLTQVSLAVVMPAV